MFHTIRTQSKAQNTLISRFVTPELLILLIWPWVLLLVYPNWVYFNATAIIDAWIYFGHFLNFQAYLSMYQENTFYYITRLSWILPGFIAYQLFPPLVANFILRLFIFYTAVISVYTTLTITIGKRAGLFAGLLLGNYSYFLLAAGWDYIDGIGLAYFALTIALLTLASRSTNSLLWMLLAGGAGAAFMSANLFGIVFLPALGVTFLLLNRHRPAFQVRRDLLVGLGGGFGLLGLLGLANLALGGDFLFLWRSFQVANSLARIESNPWITTVPNWPLHLSYTIWIVLGLIAGLLALILPQTRRVFADRPASQILVGLYLLSALTMIGLNQWSATPILNAVFYASYLIAPLFVALGTISAPAINQLRAWHFWTLIGTTAGLALIGLDRWTCQVISSEVIIPALIAGGIWICSFVLWPKQPWHLVLLIITLTLVTPHAFGTFSPDQTCEVITASHHDPADEYLAVIAANEELRRLVPNQRLSFWYNTEESSVYLALASASLYDWKWFGTMFPSLRHQMPQTATVVLLSQQPDAPNLARQIMTEHGGTFDLIAQRWITQGTVSFGMYIFETKPISATITPGDVLDLPSTDSTAVRCCFKRDILLTQPEVEPVLQTLN